MTPKATIKQEKKDKVAAIADAMKSASSVVFIDYKGLGVKTQQELASKLRETGSKMLVAKNSLLKLAGQDAKLPKETLTDTVLEGQTAVVFGEADPVSPVQIIGKFAEEFEIPKMKAGVVEGSYQDTDGLLKISKLPSKDVLYGKVVGAIASPSYGLVGTLQGNLNKLLFILNQAKEKANQPASA